jgi:hypothetical protein
MTSLETLVTQLLARVDAEDGGQGVRALSVALAETIVNSAPDHARAKLLAAVAGMMTTSAVELILNGEGRELYDETF